MQLSLSAFRWNKTRCYGFTFAYAHALAPRAYIFCSVKISRVFRVKGSRFAVSIQRKRTSVKCYLLPVTETRKNFANFVSTFLNPCPVLALPLFAFIPVFFHPPPLTLPTFPAFKSNSKFRKIFETGFCETV